MISRLKNLQRLRELATDLPVAPSSASRPAHEQRCVAFA